VGSGLNPSAPTVEFLMKGIRDAEPSRRRLARATLSDVAKEAGVSVMTVSNFVRAKPVRLQTRKRVEEAIALDSA